MHARCGTGDALPAMAQKLCQPGGGASCGACCGLYNFADHGRGALEQALTRRTDRIRSLPLELHAFRAAAAELKEQEREALFTEVRICPLLGFLDAERSRVGCLAHPLVTGGEDLRDCGVYNARTCASFECPSFLWLSDAEAALVRDACPDWYLYGLVITDVEFVRGCLRLISDASGATVDAQRLRRTALGEVARVFALKEHAPGRAHGAAVFGRFSPDGTGDASLRGLDYRQLETRPAPEDDVVLCLGYAPHDRSALEAARAVVREEIGRVVAALARLPAA